MSTRAEIAALATEHGWCRQPLETLDGFYTDKYRRGAETLRVRWVKGRLTIVNHVADGVICEPKRNKLAELRALLTSAHTVVKPFEIEQ